MFGYILVNPKTLSKAEKARYRAAYCGLCEQLHREYGTVGRAALSYDMTFVALLINSAYRLAETPGLARCLMRPAPRHAYFVSEATAYAADMNVLLAYYNELDDWRDEGDARALARSERLSRHLAGIGRRWPRQTVCAERCITRLSEMERENVLNPDEPANCFAALMAEIFDWRGEGIGAAAVAANENAAANATADVDVDVGAESVNVGDNATDAADTGRGAGLRRMGAALGRFLYLLDASNDLRDDIRKERYNPLIAQADTDFEPLLTMMIGECTGEFEALCPERDVHLLRNVLYSGVWMKFRRPRTAEASATAAGAAEKAAVADAAAPQPESSAVTDASATPQPESSVAAAATAAKHEKEAGGR
jgi:hypothetical protein